MEREAGVPRPGGGGGRGGRLRVAALAGGRAAVHALGSASLRAGAVGRRRASSGGGPSPTPAERVSRARRSTRPGVAGRPPAHGVCSSRGGGGASDSRALPEDFGQSVRNPPSADGERQSLYFAHAMCTDRDLVAGVARARLPYAANMVSGVDAAGCARDAGPGTAEAAARLTGMRCEGRGNFD